MVQQQKRKGCSCGVRFCLNGPSPPALYDPGDVLSHLLGPESWRCAGVGDDDGDGGGEEGPRIAVENWRLSFLHCGRKNIPDEGADML